MQASEPRRRLDDQQQAAGEDDAAAQGEFPSLSWATRAGQSAAEAPASAPNGQAARRCCRITALALHSAVCPHKACWTARSCCCDASSQAPCLVHLPPEQKCPSSNVPPGSVTPDQVLTQLWVEEGAPTARLAALTQHARLCRSALLQPLRSVEVKCPCGRRVSHVALPEGRAPVPLRCDAACRRGTHPSHPGPLLLFVSCSPSWPCCFSLASVASVAPLIAPCKRRFHADTRCPLAQEGAARKRPRRRVWH